MNQMIIVIKNQSLVVSKIITCFRIEYPGNPSEHGNGFFDFSPPPPPTIMKNEECNFLTGCITVIFSRRSVLRGVGWFVG